MNIKHVLAASAIAAVAIFSIGYWIGYINAPREILDEEVSYAGTLTVDTKRVLAATVESLRAQSRLSSFSYRGTASVEIERDKWYLFEGRQQLIVPADVSYFVDMTMLKDTDVSFDAVKNEVTVLLPKLMLTVAFDPSHASEVNTGSLTFSDEVVKELRKINYESAKKTIIKQGQQAEMVRQAKENTQKSIEAFFDIALAIAGKSDVRVNVQFKS